MSMEMKVVYYQMYTNDNDVFHNAPTYGITVVAVLCHSSLSGRLLLQRTH